MKKETTKQADNQTAPGTQSHYPKVHTKTHPNAYKVPIADLLNPACPISAGVSENLRAELIKKQAKGAQYHYIEDFMFTYNDVQEARKAATKGIRQRLEQSNVSDRYEQEKPTVCSIEAALDPDNPISVLALTEEHRKAIQALKNIGDAIAPILPPDAATFFIANIEKVVPLVTEKLTARGLDPGTMSIQEVAESGALAEALTEAGYIPAEDTAEDLPTIIAARVNKINLPIDVINNNIWQGLSLSAKTGQYKFDIPTSLESFDLQIVNAAKKGSNEALIIYGLDFSGLSDISISKQLTVYDKRVYIAIGALWRYFIDDLNIPADQIKINIASIYYAMGYDKTPNARDIQRINDSITKMSSARLYLNNYYELQEHKNRISVDKDMPLLPCKRATGKLNGVIVNSAIKPYEEPPLITFARERGQITTIKRSLLASPVSKTDLILRIEDYLLIHIAMLKDSKNNMDNTTLLYKTIFTRLEIKKTEYMKQKRAKDTIKNLLNYYTTEGFIKGYKEKQLKGGEGIELFIDQTRIAPPKK